MILSALVVGKRSQSCGQICIRMSPLALERGRPEPGDQDGAGSAHAGQAGRATFRGGSRLPSQQDFVIDFKAEGRSAGEPQVWGPGV